MFEKGSEVEVCDLDNRWYKAVIEELDVKNACYSVSFEDWKDVKGVIPFKARRVRPQPARRTNRRQSNLRNLGPVEHREPPRLVNVKKENSNKENQQGEMNKNAEPSSPEQKSSTKSVNEARTPKRAAAAAAAVALSSASFSHTHSRPVIKEEDVSVVRTRENRVTADEAKVAKLEEAEMKREMKRIAERRRRARKKAERERARSETRVVTPGRSNVSDQVEEPRSRLRCRAGEKTDAAQGRGRPRKVQIPAVETNSVKQYVEEVPVVESLIGMEEDGYESVHEVKCIDHMNYMLWEPLRFCTCPGEYCEERESEFDDEVEGEREEYLSMKLEARITSDRPVQPVIEGPQEMNVSRRSGDSSCHSMTDDDTSPSKRRGRRTSEAQKLQIDHPGRKVIYFSNLVECVIDGCKKTFRKDTSLADHIKYFHHIDLSSSDSGSPNGKRKKEDKISPVKKVRSVSTDEKVEECVPEEPSSSKISASTDADMKASSSIANACDTRCKRRKRKREIEPTRSGMASGRKSTRSSTRLISESSNATDHPGDATGERTRTMSSRSLGHAESVCAVGMDLRGEAGKDDGLTPPEQEVKELSLFDKIEETVFMGELIAGNAVVVQWGSRRYRGRVSEPKGDNYVVAFKGGLVCTVMRKDIFPLSHAEVIAEHEGENKKKLCESDAAGEENTSVGLGTDCGSAVNDKSNSLKNEGSALKNGVSGGLLEESSMTAASTTTIGSASAGGVGGSTSSIKLYGPPKIEIRIPKYNRKAAEEGTLIACLCGYDMDSGHMIQCEHCLAWQHSVCVGVDAANVPEEYVCKDCFQLQKTAEDAFLLDSTFSSKTNIIAQSLGSLMCPPTRDNSCSHLLCKEYDDVLSSETVDKEDKEDNIDNADDTIPMFDFSKQQHTEESSSSKTCDQHTTVPVSKCMKMLRIYAAMMRDCSRLEDVINSCGATICRARKNRKEKRSGMSLAAMMGNNTTIAKTRDGQTTDSEDEEDGLRSFEKTMSVEKDIDSIEEQTKRLERECAYLRKVMNRMPPAPKKLSATPNPNSTDTRMSSLASQCNDGDTGDYDDDQLICSIYKMYSKHRHHPTARSS